MEQQEILKQIKSRLSLRKPLQESLDIVARISALLPLEEIDNPTVLQEALARIRSEYQSCQDFERNFVSVAFNIATGVGKTRLMGAIIAYLYMTGRSRNFFILAPNLTIYNKLMDDFGNPAAPKYVFRGIDVFVQNRPIIINSDNYARQSGLFAQTEVRINVFNVQTFNRDINEAKSEKGRPPRIKRMSEYLGESYWSFLTRQNDLVILMDEAHRYHADKTKSAIDELKPVLGIELTATPYDEKGKLFRNVVYEYTLAKALEEGRYIKIPAIATRQDFNKKTHTSEEVERIKLEDAISVHERTRTELERYARDYQKPMVKPFMLVVCRDTKHAAYVLEYIQSDAFYKGRYREKVIQVDTSQSAAATQANEQLLLEIEKTSNPIEIVIHVNMLKEGWDVTNLYTIVPLRAAQAATLIEQTIGRGLRLPYGERVGDVFVDTLTVIAHDNFEAVISAAKDPKSVLNKMQYIELGENELDSEPHQVIQALDRESARVLAERKKIEVMTNASERQKALYKNDAEVLIINTLPQVARAVGITKIEDLDSKKAQEAAVTLITQELASRPPTLYSETEHAQIVEEAKAEFQRVVKSFRKSIIEIPRFTVQPAPPVAIYHDFDLDVSDGKFSFQELQNTILRESLVDGARDIFEVQPGATASKTETPLNKIISELLTYHDIDYDKCSTLITKLAQQAIAQISRDKADDKMGVERVVNQYKVLIAKKIYQQIKAHFELRPAGFQMSSSVLPFTKIESWNITAPPSAPRLSIKEGGVTASELRKLIFKTSEKACHTEYKFDSLPELAFARILEDDKAVIRWMRPAPTQFQLYYDNQSRQYRPDFVAETDACIYLLEVKAENELESADVLSKAESARTFCAQATNFNEKHGKKPWEYKIVPANEVRGNSSFVGLVGR